MALFPLKIPPGMFRPGTKYDAKGRWFDGTLIRWYEGIMQAIGGWQVLNRTSIEDVDAAIADDGGVFTDETADANDPGAGDVQIFPAVPANGDKFYVGFDHPFAQVDFVISTAMSSSAIVNQQYFNGTTFVSTIGNSTGTSSGGDPFQQSGTNTHIPQKDWAKTTINGQGPFYFLKWEVVAAGTPGPIADTIDISVGPVQVDDPPRGAITWRTNSALGQLAFGTATELFVFGSGDLEDVTPAGFTTGLVDATQTSGNYGSGAYGTNPYGVGDTSQTNITEANTWQLDNFGENLVAVAFSDGKIYERDTFAGGVAVAVVNAPTDCKGVVVTPERFLVALAAAGDRRLVQWADVDDNTVWAAAPENQAGDLLLPGRGEILAGRRGRNETLIWTTVDLFAMRYIGGQFVYTIPQVGSNCGAISRRAMQVVDGQAVWMGARGFFSYNGFVKPLPSEVGDFVFNDLNLVQVSKIWCDLRSAYGEVTWYYPSASSSECDKYVTFNYRAGFWYFGELERTAGTDRGVFDTSFASDATAKFYQHEVGFSYLDPDEVALVPFAETGPIEIGQGDRVMVIQDVIADELTLGDLDVTLFTALYPTATETESSVLSATNPMSVREQGRQVRFKIVQDQTGWRLGTFRLDVEPGGMR